MNKISTLIIIAIIGAIIGNAACYILSILVTSGIATWALAIGASYVVYKKFGDKIDAFFAGRRAKKA